LRLQVLKKFKKIGFMFSDGPRLHIEERKERIIHGLSWIEIITGLLILRFREKPLPLVLIGVKPIVPIRKDDDHFLKGMKGIVQILLGVKVVGDDRLGNFLRSIISLAKTSKLRELLEPLLQRFLQISISPTFRIRHRISDDSNVFIQKPMIFFLLHLAKEPLCFFRRGDFPPDSRPMKVIPVQKKKDWILGHGILIKIFWEDDKEPLLLIQ
jgi:hypothetical protein